MSARAAVATPLGRLRRASSLAIAPRAFRKMINLLKPGGLIALNAAPGARGAGARYPPCFARRGRGVSPQSGRFYRTHHRRRRMNWAEATFARPKLQSDCPVTVLV